MTDILLFLACIIFGLGLYMLIARIIIPRYFLRRHRIAFDVDDNAAFYAAFKVCRELRLFGVLYDETDDDVSIVRFVVPIWKEKKVLGAFRVIENVEVY